MEEHKIISTVDFEQIASHIDQTVELLNGKSQEPQKVVKIDLDNMSSKSDGQSSEESSESDDDKQLGSETYHNFS